MEITNTAPALPGGPPRRGGASAPEAPTRDRAHAMHVLERRRIAAGFDTSTDLATASGVTRSAIDKIEAGRVDLVRTKTARKLADALQVPLLVLIGELRAPYEDLTEPQAVVVESGASA